MHVNTGVKHAHRHGYNDKNGAFEQRSHFLFVVAPSDFDVTTASATGL